MANLLIVDDEESYRRVLKVIFEAEGYHVQTATNGREALEHLKNELLDVIISDVKMPDMDGIGLLTAAREISQDIGIVLMTAFGTIETAREAFKLGADDFIQKPFNNEELKLIVKRTLHKKEIIHENRAFRRVQRIAGSVKNIVGQSGKMQELSQMIEMVSKENMTVLITGESGTGKELVARAIHDLSSRADKPFVPLNCGAIPENLIEAELFGFMKGTFTGAVKDRIGLFQSADKGSIFLDEIGDMPPSLQVKVLRVLQENKIRPVGAAAETAIDTRVIAATNCNIKKMVGDGSFRRDLFYRLSVVPIHIAPLRERREDIPDLVNHFVKQFCARSGKNVSVSPQTLEILQNRIWNGNVRELEHTIERAVALTRDGEEIAPRYCAEDISEYDAHAVNLPEDGLNLTGYMNNLEKDFVIEALRRTGGNQTRAAEILQIQVYALRHLLTKHNIDAHSEPKNLKIVR